MPHSFSISLLSVSRWFLKRKSLCLSFGFVHGWAVLREASDLHQEGGFAFISPCLSLSKSLTLLPSVGFVDCRKISLHKIVKVGKDFQDHEVLPLITYHNALESRNVFVKTWWKVVSQCYPGRRITLLLIHRSLYVMFPRYLWS